MRQKTRTIYLLFTRSETYPSRAIHFFTHGEYTHVSIGLEGPAGVFYSFARKYPQYPLPGGLVQEQTERGFYSIHPDVPCCLRTLAVSEDTYRFLRRRLGNMLAPPWSGDGTSSAPSLWPSCSGRAARPGWRRLRPWSSPWIYTDLAV